MTVDFAKEYLLDDCANCPENKNGECMTESHCFEVKRMAIKALEQEPVLDKIRAEIESNMESIVGKYDSSIPKSNMPSYKIERNKVRKECISIIDKYRVESEGEE